MASVGDFKKGDKLRCIRTDNDCMGILKEGAEYTFNSYREGTPDVWLEETVCSYQANRFELVTEETPVTQPVTTGEHYNPTTNGIMCWDFIIAMDLGFLEGNILKYITRWRKKGGVKDLEKALTYTEKLIEEHKEHCKFGYRPTRRLLTDAYIRDNGLGEREGKIAHVLTSWENQADLYRLQHQLDCLIEEAKWC